MICIHRYLGVCLFIFIVISATTGFLRANYRWYWKEGYKQKKQVISNIPLTSPSLSIEQVFKIVNKKNDGTTEVEHIKLKGDFGRLLYEVKLKNDSKFLIDAQTGKPLSPLKEELVKKIASQYIKGKTEVQEITKLKQYIPRKEKEIRPVYKVSFNDRLHTEIFLDINTGEIVEELDDQRKMALWIIRLHDYNVFGLKRIFLSFVGIGLLLLTTSGFYLWLSGRPLKKGEKNV